MSSKNNINLLPKWFSNTGTDSDVVVSTRVRLARCFSDYRFPAKSSLLERKNIFNMASKAILELKDCDVCRSVNFSETEISEQEVLFEKCIVSPELLSAEGDRGVIYNEPFDTSIMINEEDHIRIQSLTSGFSGDTLWDKVSKIDDEIGNSLQYAYDNEKGFLTCCPSNSGTGLKISYLMHLPGLVLTKTIDQVLLGASQMSLSTRSFWGENPSSVVGNFFQLSNQSAMGLTEKQFLDNTRDIVANIIEYEKSAMNKILNDARLELEDKIFRAYGILVHARTLTVNELLNLTSAIRTGIEYKIFNIINIKKLNELIIKCLPAHLQDSVGKSIDDDELKILRAELVRKTLTGKV